MTAPYVLESLLRKTLTKMIIPVETPGPLGRLSEVEIAHLLRGFSEATVAGALGLRMGSRIADFEACLFGLFLFYSPAGTEGPEERPPGQARLREDLGVDSLSLSEAMFKVEELFDICIDNEELAEIDTIADARRLLEVKLQPRMPT